jgi:N-acetylglutamate synthase-like GNAT family acetyltransferase
MEIVAARPGDMPLIESEVQRMRLDSDDLGVEQFLVALDGDAVVGFGRIKPHGDGVFELATVAVLESHRRQGVGRALVTELMKRFPTEEIYIATDLVEYFMRFGFTPTAVAPKAIVAKVDTVGSSLRSGVVAMAMRRKRR